MKVGISDTRTQNAAKFKLQGIQEQLKHIHSELKALKPELQKVCSSFRAYLHEIN